MKLPDNYTIKIAIVDDSAFYSSILKRQIENTMNHLASDNHVKYEVSVYTSSTDFLNNHPGNQDIVFLDYYLDDGLNALDVLEEINPLRNGIKVAMISNFDNYFTAHKAMAKGAMTFIQKDNELLLHTSDFLDYVVNSYYKNNETHA